MQCLEQSHSLVPQAALHHSKDLLKGWCNPVSPEPLVHGMTYLKPTTAGPGRSSHQVGAKMPVFLQER
ncbi:hypothetical protein FOVSG1_014334 [Fusarium oxysporum f. sp. vasinfectum]